MGTVPVSVSVDRVSLLKHVTDKEENGAFNQLMWSFIKDKEYKGSKVWKTQYVTKAHIMLAGKVPFNMQAGIAHGKPYSKITIWPGAMQKSHWDEVNGFLSMGVADGLSGMARTAKPSYIEIAADCRNIEVHTLLPYENKLLDSSRLPNPPEPAQTYYLGAKKSTRHFSVYDKKRQLLEIKKVKLEHELTRIEVILRNLGMRLAGVAYMPNPFAGMGVCRLSDAFTISKSKKWQMFLDIAEQQGTQVALLWAGKDRAEYLARLRSIRCSWWNTAKVWKKAQVAITSLNAKMTAYYSD